MPRSQNRFFIAHHSLAFLAVMVVAAGSFAQASYVWKSVAIHGGGFVPGIVMHPAVAGLMYARTDVGGAYRWDQNHWVPITDWIGQTDGLMLGCESIAVDPEMPDRVYLAMGTYTNFWGKNGAIYRSDNRGNSFVRTSMPFKMGGNDPGRSVGERLTVDPNDSDILFFGSRADGLWRSADAARTWKKVEGFPAVATSPAACEPGGTEWADGISFVKIIPGTDHRGRPGAVIYAGVCTQQTSLFRSTDAGATWAPIAGAPTGLRPNHAVVSSAGDLFISYGDQAGPNGMQDGAIDRFNPTTNQWTDLTPVKPSAKDRFGYGAISLDAKHPGWLMACSLDRWGHGDTVFRTVDGGNHWTEQTVGGRVDKSLFDSSAAPWAASLSPHWLGDIEIDPFDSNHTLFVTGYGIWATHDAANAGAGKPMHWTFADDGLEETVPLELISPGQGAHLISTIGDFDGFTHDDLDRSPRAGRHRPSVGTTSGLDFAENKPECVVRAGGRGQGFFSNDGGHAWTPFASVPPGAHGGGQIAMASDGNTILWKPDGASTYRSTDLGKTWALCGGLRHPSRPIADRANPHHFYAIDASEDHLCISDDGGATFTSSPLEMPRQSRSIRAVPGFAGHLWICAGNQLLRSTDGGTSAVKINTVNRATQIGFGKPSPGSHYPAIFIAGEVGGITGVFRSDDQAKSWQQIDDENHRYGSINIVIGDPRIYGRVYLGTSGRGIVYGDLPGSSVR